jgi:hypothetical protein
MLAEMKRATTTNNIISWWRWDKEFVHGEVAKVQHQTKFFYFFSSTTNILLEYFILLEPASPQGRLSEKTVAINTSTYIRFMQGYLIFYWKCTDSLSSVLSITHFDLIDFKIKCSKTFLSEFSCMNINYGIIIKTLWKCIIIMPGQCMGVSIKFKNPL